MSYTRTFHKTITLYYSKTVTVKGESVTVSGSVSDDVAVNIHVQTDPFDSQVHSVNSNVNLLTGAIAATEVAQVASLSSNAKKIGASIVDGFFKTVRSEISQQISELKADVDSTLIHLRELSKKCIDKKRQMQVDYDRLASRYTKLFTDLNRELENRVYMLDKPAFDVQRNTQKCILPLIESELVSEAAVTSAEEAQATALMSGARSKALATDTIASIDAYLQEQAETAMLLRRCTVPSSGKPVKYAPVIHFQRVAPDQSIKRDTYAPASLMPDAKKSADALMQGYPWQKLSDDNMIAINQHFEENLSEGAKSASPHANRVREMARQLFNADARRAFNFQN